MSLMGLDIGTTGCKAVAFDESGNILAAAYREYPLVQPREDWVELQPELIWAKVQEILAEVNTLVKADPVSALAVSAQGEAVTAINKQGDSLYNFIVTFDNRTVGQIGFWQKHSTEKELYQITGMPLHPMYTINKILWFKNERPDIYLKTWKFLMVEDFIIYRLSAELGVDYTLASRTMAFDVNTKQWSSHILGIAGVGEELLAPTVPSGTIMGSIKKELAGILGFQGTVPVVTGGHDQPCGALGAGVIQSGTAMNATGTVDAICPVSQELKLTDTMRRGNFAMYPYVVPDLFCSLGFNLTGGLLLRWYRDTLCQDEQRRARESACDPYEIILREMSNEPKNLFMLPHFVGTGTPYLDPGAKGALVGLKISTTKADITRSIVDGVNYEMRLNIEYMRENDIVLNEIRSVGGGAKSAKWLQLKANCLGIPVHKPKTSEAVSLGAAILAGYAIGEFKNISEGVTRMVSIAETYYPEPESQKIYEEKYQKYKELYPLLKTFNQNLD
jgi:xylulokinase